MGRYKSVRKHTVEESHCKRLFTVQMNTFLHMFTYVDVCNQLPSAATEIVNGRWCTKKAVKSNCITFPVHGITRRVEGWKTSEKKPPTSQH